jgi:hypothetical protein
MSEHAPEQHMIYPTYSSILLTLIHDIIMEFGKGDYPKAWVMMHMLYKWLPSECKAEVKEEYEKAVAKANTYTSVEIGVNPIWRSDISMRRIIMSKELSNLTFHYLLTLSGLIQTSLEVHGYLGKEGAKPRITTAPRLKTDG